MKDIVKRAEEVACKIIIEAGNIAKDRFDQAITVEEKDDFGDLVTEVDHLAESVILAELKKEFPTHSIHSEEAGDNGVESDWLWLIDPLDGTNNFAIGFPVFATSITLLYKKEPVLGVIYEPMVNRLFVSSLQGGMTCNNQPVKMKKKENPSRFTVGWIQGHGVQSDETAVQLRHHIDNNCKRMMRLFAPTPLWCMLARGDIDGIVLYNPESDDLYSGILMVKEAGGIVIDFEGNVFSGMSSEPYLIACHPDHKEYFVQMVKEGLGLLRVQLCNIL